ncbi:hypothetical protein [Janthinobacterium sp. 1_2014MBL_MicDiv]|uniref:hypothetical protein n=1 Tax=Janthinobacterium sp. 1_2014MBL_MicDiv TaxID=1644131 RepID=UPI0008F510F9|nr:hypothetical protein [Janthinobacterium sp. 1_2014MBL_MicDiv]APA68314.1 hypothetical protein YQ44_11315 [Janthinobacterium sp. 1_2014MBL_MicDiv]
MPVGANPKREREFRKLDKDFKQEGRYRGREEEVAARIVNKQRAQAGETLVPRAGKPTGKGGAPELPIDGYQHLTVAQICGKLEGLSAADLKRLRTYEMAHKKRKGVLQALGA